MDKFDWTPYGRERWTLGELHDALEREFSFKHKIPWSVTEFMNWSDKKIKPFLTAADLVMLREMKVRL